MRERIPKRETIGGVKFVESNRAHPPPAVAVRIELNRLTALCFDGEGPSGRHLGRTTNLGR